MIVETERLEIIALEPAALKLLCEDVPALEKAYNCTYKAEPMKGIFLDIVKGQLTAAENDEGNYLWHSFWLIMRKKDRTVVGLFDFKDVPDINGETEIGYGLTSEFEHKGYMTETVRAMSQWAMEQKNVKHLTAETETDGIASQNILKACGFEEFSRMATVWWRL